MIHVTNPMRKMTLVFSLVISAHLNACARDTDVASGTWKFEKSQVYQEPNAPAEPPPFESISIQNNVASFSPSCKVAFTQRDYSFGMVFQAMSKAGDTEPPLDRFLTKNFALPLAKTKSVLYFEAPARNCARPVINMFFTGKRIVIPAGGVFFSYTNATTAPESAKPAPAKQGAADLVAPYKITPLPMDFDRYLSQCTPKILNGRRLPRTTDQCAPSYFPYVADPKSKDPLMNIVGNHEYKKGGSEFADLFSPPFKMKTAATFLVYPPMNNMVVVRVDDFEAVKNEQREIMNGVYLSIVDGKVVDQIEGCDLNRDYVCMSEGAVVGRLSANGKFQRK